MAARVVRLVLLGGAAVGSITGVYYQRRLRANKAVDAARFNEAAEGRLAELRARPDRLYSPELSLTLYRYATCPFCSKVTTFLDVHGVAYDTVEVDPMFKAQLSGHGYGKVPQLRLSDRATPAGDAAHVSADAGHAGDGRSALVVDSRLIVDALAPVVRAAAGGAPMAAAVSAEERESEERWRDWAATDLVRLLVVNNNRSLAEAAHGYKYVDEAEGLPFATRLFLKAVGGPTMFAVARFVTRKKLHKGGFPPDVLDGHERDVLQAQLRLWADEGLRGRPFHGGERPSVADLDVYGVVRSCRGLPVWDAIEGSAASAWIARMEVLASARRAALSSH